MALQMANSDIARQASLCQNLLHSGCARAQEIPFGLDEEQLARFNLWASHIGVFAGGRASLDYRLQDAPVVRKAVCDLLLVLQLQLESIDQVLSEPDYATKSLGKVDHTTPLQASIEEKLSTTEDVITRLHGLSLAIRRAGARNPLSKVAVFPICDEEGNDASKEFTKFIDTLLRIRIQTDISDVLRKRLQEAICFRRRRFDYALSHSSKLRRATNEVAARTFPAGETSVTGKGSSDTASQTSVPLEKGPQSSTTASRYDHEAWKSPRPSYATSTISTTFTTISNSKKLELDDEGLPPPPKFSPNTIEYTCDLCCVVHPADEFRKKRLWILHAERDIEPYVCIYDDCSKHSEMFASTRAWIKHTNEEHGIEWVRSLPSCATSAGINTDVDNPSDSRLCGFSNEAEYMRHLQNRHKSQFSPFQMSVLATRNRRRVATFTSCPFCVSDDLLAEDIPAHLAGHLRVLASMSLPIRHHPDNSGSEHTPSSSAPTREGSDLDRKFPEDLTTNYATEGAFLSGSNVGESTSDDLYDPVVDQEAEDADPLLIRDIWERVRESRDENNIAVGFHLELKSQLPDLMTWLFGDAASARRRRSIIFRLPRLWQDEYPRDITIQETPSLETMDKALFLYVQHTLEQGEIDLNKADTRDGRTILSRAAERGYDMVAGFVLASAQVDVNNGDFVGRTPLVYSASNGHLSVTERLLKAKADPNSIDFHFDSALSLASAGDYPQVVKLLVDAGATEPRKPLQDIVEDKYPRYATSQAPPTFQDLASLARSRPLTSKRANVSTMSLPRFRQEKPRLFWPVDTHDAMIEIKLAENLADPDLFGIEYLDGVVGFSGNKTMVIKGKVWKENRQPEVLAIKIILYDDKQTRSKAIEEFRILQSIKHHHIIAVIGSCSTELNGEIRLGILLYPLAKMNLEQYLKNISEDRVVDSKARSARELLSFYACLCQTVLHLHARKSPIKHRDIKPTNILVDSEGTVILADFDIAKQYDDKDMALTIRNMEYTIRYAPKHVVNQTLAGLEWDINSLGFVFLEMATVILGKSIEELPPFLHENYGSKVTKRESIARTTDTTETAGMNEILFSDALEEGTIGKWFEELDHHASKNRSSVPTQLRTSTAVEKFLAMIDKMMRAETDGNGSVLRDAQEFFSTLSEPCKYCRATLVT